MRRLPRPVFSADDDAVGVTKGARMFVAFLGGDGIARTDPARCSCAGCPAKFVDPDFRCGDLPGRTLLPGSARRTLLPARFFPSRSDCRRLACLVAWSLAGCAAQPQAGVVESPSWGKRDPLLSVGAVTSGIARCGFCHRASRSPIALPAVAHRSETIGSSPIALSATAAAVCILFDCPGILGIVVKF